MKKVVLSIGFTIAVLCTPLVNAFSQDTTKQQNEKEIEVQIENMEQKMEEMARKLEVMVEKLNDKVRKGVEDELAEELKKILKDLEYELEEVGEEIDKEIEEIEVEVEKRRKDGDREIEIEIEEEEEYKLGDVLDGLEIKFNKKKDKLKDVKTRWLLVDLGFASYVSPDPLPEINGINPMEVDLINSVSWRLHVFNQRINLYRHYMNLVYGTGFAFNFYGFSNPATILPSQPQVAFTLEENDFSFKKNHLRASYIHIPVLLNIETNPYQKSKSFHLNAGVYGNILMGGKTAQKTNHRKIKTKDKFNLENFQYGLIGNIGYGPVTFYGSYGLNELFKPEKDNGYTVNPITFGVRIIPF